MKCVMILALNERRCMVRKTRVLEPWIGLGKRYLGQVALLKY